MAIDLSEEEMRKALFGAGVEPIVPNQAAATVDAPSPTPRTKNTTGYHSPRLRVTLHVSKEFEGDVDVFVHDSSSLSKLVAEQEAKSAARKKKYRYIEVVSIEPTSK